MTNAIKTAEIWTHNAEKFAENAAKFVEDNAGIDTFGLSAEEYLLQCANSAWDAEQEVEMLEDMIPEDNAYYQDLRARANEASNKARMLHDEWRPE
jgi:hypothetical protein